MGRKLLARGLQTRRLLWQGRRGGWVEKQFGVLSGSMLEVVLVVLRSTEKHAQLGIRLDWVGSLHLL